MPTWGVLGALALVAVMSVGAVLAMPQTPTADPNRTPRPVPTFSFGQSAPSASPEDESTATDDPLGQIQSLIASRESIVISVLGDSTGNGPNEWVARWARHLGENGRQVTVHYWDDVAGAFTEPPSTYGSGGAPVEIWNGSMPGKNATNALNNLAALQPVRPDLILYNFGHNIGPAPVDVVYDEIQALAETTWGSPILRAAMLQNPAHASREAATASSQERILAWSSSSGVPIVNVRDAFLANPDWIQDYMADEVHPQDDGSQVWADTVAEALG